MTNTIRTRLVLTAAGAAAAALLLTACSTPPWLEQSATAPSAAPTADATTITVVENDLAAGSLTRELQAGGVVVDVDYWSDVDLADWTADALKPLSISLSAAAPTAGVDVVLARTTVTTAVSGDDGALAAPAAFEDVADVDPGYTVTAPFSYGQTFVVPAVDAGATSIRFSLTYEFLVQTTPGSGDWTKQTAVDTITVPVAD